MGLFLADTVKRELGWADTPPLPASKDRPCQSSTGVFSLRPSHQGSLSAVSATLVNNVSRWIMSKALRLVARFVPGTTPK
jgi:hypothetical protein